MKRLAALAILALAAFLVTWPTDFWATPALSTDAGADLARHAAALHPALRVDGGFVPGPARSTVLDRLAGMAAREVAFTAYAGDSAGRDIYTARAVVDARGRISSLSNVTNRTATPDGDEALLVSGGARVAYATRVGDAFQLVTVADPSLNQEGRIVVILGQPQRQVRLQWEDGSLLTIVPSEGNTLRLDAGAGTLTPPGAQARLVVASRGELAWLPRLVNAVRDHPWVGPEKIALLENVYFFLVDIWDRATYSPRAPGSPPSVQIPSPPATSSPAATAASAASSPEATPTGQSVATPVLPPASPTPLPALQPSDKRWAELPLDVGMPHYSVYPDASRPFAKVEVVTIDPARFNLHLVGGTAEPRSTTGIVGTGVIPDDPATRGSLVAAFNGGWAAMHGHYGMMIDRQVYLPARNGIATLAWYADGSLRLGVWGRDIQPSPDIVTYRQNCLPLIENGVVSPELGKLSLWGLSISDEAVIYRSGLGQTRDGKLVYAAGNALSALTLAKVLHEAGAYNAMLLDIDDFHVAFITYRQATGPDGKPAVVGAKLRQDMQGFDGHFLQPFALDFIYVTRKAEASAARPTTIPSPSVPTAATPATSQPLPDLPGRIAFQSTRDGDWEIYAMPAAGGQVTRLTTSSGDDLYPAWSPDGQNLAFTSGRSGDWDIYTMAADGSAPLRRTDRTGNEWYPAWSPDGSLIAFQTDWEGNAEIYGTLLPSGDIRKLTRHKGNNERPTWSPDGLRLAFDTDFMFYGTVSAGIDLYVMEVTGTLTPTKVVGNAEYPAWSPDGSRLAYQSEVGSGWDIYTIGVDGRGARRITTHWADDRYPVWSPDGLWLAFSSNRDGPWEIYATLADGSGPAYRLTYGGGVHPAWTK